MNSADQDNASGSSTTKAANNAGAQQRPTAAAKAATPARSPSNTAAAGTARTLGRGGEISLDTQQQKQREVIDRLRLHLCSSFQTTLEPLELLQLFFEQLSTLLGISGVSFTPVVHAGMREKPSPSMVGKPAIHLFTYQLCTGETDIGELCCYSRKRVSGLNIEVLEVATSTLIYPMHNALLFQRTLALAETDSLTGLGNRQAMHKSLAKLVAAARRYERPLSLLMLDIDHFKKVNDTFGHSSGDAALFAVAEAIREVCRDTDSAFRFGGEEFLILLDNTDGIGAAVAAERLRKRIATLNEGDGVPTSLTASIGSAAWQEEESPSALIVRADQALYRAKSAGRNRSVAA
ncbi:MAG: GGDEF domain-containing protein [Gammaproteobacteria bacterium]|nr:GGDEF domain-containing protein [Gammaproteobacteria bacterium]